jgi:pyruvate/2-oxoglutarate dehydrogenase complex dihydrolipoamide dehydrogenase (E3) component
MTDAEAQKTGRPILTAQRPMTRVGRAVEKGETRGLMKVVVDAGTKQILGAAILGTGGDEAIHGLLDAVNAGLPFDVAARRSHSSDGVGIDSHAARRSFAVDMTTVLGEFTTKV